ncbi:MAG: hypothetical protein ACHQ7N_17205 [Candidatus Methylomirabilales bacterium]
MTEGNNFDGLPHDSTRRASARIPRRAQLDAPGTLHHVILRGIERGQIVADGEDRESFLARLGLSLAATARLLGVSTSGVAKAGARAERPSVH